MPLLERLITDKTEIIELEPCKISAEEKRKVIDLKSELTPAYIKNMYLYNGIWHYFKKDNNKDTYYYSVVDELVGSRLAKGRNLPAVSFKIARLKDNTLGIVSPNFKQKEYKYNTLDEIVDSSFSYKDPIKLELLFDIPNTEENKEIFIKHLFNLFAIDIHMLQKDRANVNLQFQTNLSNGFFDIAHLYDFATCAEAIGREGINIPSEITRLDFIHIISLAKKYPVFKEALEYILEEDMASIWLDIGKEYNFDTDSFIFNKVLERYQEKEKSQKKYIKELLYSINR